jgi:spore coat polysaccharide biosynthesis protein SpsF
VNIVAIIQARTSSTRFPNKVFANLSERPLIWHVVNRLKFSKKITEIVLATTNNPNDDALQEWAIKENVSYFRGSEENVLNRFYNAAKIFNADVVVRITSDDPFKDVQVVDDVIEMLLNNNLDFAYNNHPTSFPEGLDTEVFTFKSLEQADKNASTDFEKEHVTQYFYKNLSLFKHANFSYSKNISKLRWTIDTEQDFNMCEIIYNELYKEGEIFLLNDILDFLEKRPEVSEMNLNVKRSTMYN